MAEHGSTGTHSHGFEEHAKTYDGFIKASIAGTILCFYVLVALVAFAFIASATNGANWRKLEALLLRPHAFVMGAISVVMKSSWRRLWTRILTCGSMKSLSP